MDRHAYNAFVRDSMRGQIALVILINTHHETESKDLLQTFWSIASRYTDYRLKLCYLCYHTHSKWLENILSQCHEIDSDEIKLRTSGCLLSQVATIVALLGSRRQFCAFPEVVPLSHIQEGGESDKVLVTEMVGTSATQDVVGINNRGKLDTRFASQIVETSSESSVKTNPDVKQGQSQSQTVGSVLGSALGFTEDNDSETEAETIGPNDSRQEGHRTDSDVFYGNGTAAHTGTTKLTAIGDLPPRLKDEAGGTPTVHKNGSINKEKRLKHDSRVDQIRNKFEMWMERLADGSLKRCTVDSWPEWRT